MSDKRKITHIYQEQYQNWNSSGLGDFIRGSFFLMQVCDKYNIEYEISFKNHLLYKFLKNSDMNEYNGISDMNIIKFLDNNFIPHINKDSFAISYKTKPENIIMKMFFEYINSIKSKDNYNKNININIICFPLYREIDIKHKEYMKNLFEPTDLIKQWVINKLTNMNVIVGQYNIIQIRCGDNTLINNVQNYSLYNKIYHKLAKIVNENLSVSGETYIIISDSNEFKKIIKTKLPFFKVNEDNYVKHIGERNINTDESIKSLLLDFYFMSYSKNILSFSVYNHGSGLSLWCSKIYDIPYNCYLL